MCVSAPYNNNEVTMKKGEGRHIGTAAENVEREYNYVEDYESYHLFLRPLQHAMLQAGACTRRRDVSSM